MLCDIPFRVVRPRPLAPLSRVLACCGDLFHEPRVVRVGLVNAMRFADVSIDWCHDAKLPDPPILRGYSLIVLAKANVLSVADPRVWLPPGDSRITDYVVDGGWLLVVHSGLSGYKSVEPLHTIVRGAFVQHPPPCPVQLKSVRATWLTSGVEFPFSVFDEHYFVQGVQREDEVFLQSESAHGVQNAGWIRNVGRGRVVVLTPGHFVEVWRHESFSRMIGNLFSALRDRAVH